MRLFAYYALHSIVNTLKKLLKTWIAVFLAVCVLIGVVGGIFASSLEKAEKKKKAAENVSTELQVTEEAADTEAKQGFTEAHGITKEQMVEGIIAVVVLAWLLLQIANADGASKIFKPADVTLLFSSPMKPQSVMLFRLLSSMGVIMFASVYMLAQIPNLVVNAGLSTWGAISLVICYGFLLVYGTLAQVTVYTIASRHPFFKKNLVKIVAGIALAIVVGFAVFLNVKGGDIIRCAVLYFSNPSTRFVPIWGWMRGFCMSAIEGNGVWCAVFGGLLIAGLVGLIALIWSLDADFYEDAIQSTERFEALMESSKNGTAVRRKKDRSEKIGRDGLRHGWGANVFFFKSMYNRFRFSTLHFFTKTFIVYMVISVVGSYFCRKIPDFNGFIIVALVIGLLTFYRTLGNPLYEDTSMGFFVMIPESATKKLLWSLFAGLTNCFMDIIVPIAFSAIWLKAGIASTVMWTLLILSIDFFGTTVGSFINISVPTNAGSSIKQVVQIMFIYFGIMPAAGLVIAGLVLEKIVLFMSIAVFINVLLGIFFFALTPGFLENGNK